jgi:aspartyl-tRNA(Asn)/glutamyl-tRNA(Gln) amidotransferase subunit A
MTRTSVMPASAAADVLPLTISAAAARLRDGSLTATDLVRTVLARADALDGPLGTYITRLDDSALAAAAKADEELAAGLDKGPLHGIPIGIKDIIAAEGGSTTAQSLILRPEFGAQGDAPVIARLRAAGAVITGKTTTMEYACGMPDPAKGFPMPRNAFGLDYWPGGSSSGSGSGVAAGMFLGALGTDTGGSVRLPAAWSGISGLKQTFGRVPKSGCTPLGYCFDNIGPMTRSAFDCALMLNVLAVHDESDACSADVPVHDYAAALTGDIEGLRIGIDSSVLELASCDPEIAALTRAAVTTLAEAGAAVREIKIPLREEIETVVLAAQFAEAFAYHRTDLRTRWTDYGGHTRAAIGRGALITSADFVQMQRVRRAAVRAAARMFRDVDLILTPTTLVPPIAPLGPNLADVISGILTPYWNGVGYPAISIPMGLTSAGLPAGLELAGRPFEEVTVLNAAHAFQLRTGHHLTESPVVLEMLA